MDISIKDILAKKPIQVSEKTRRKFDVMKALMRCFDMTSSQAAALCNELEKEAGYNPNIPEV